MIERYGTGIPRIKRDCDEAGVRFRYRQTVNTAVIRFDRPGSQIIVGDINGASTKGAAATKGNTGTIPEAVFEMLGKNERKAMALVTANGRITTRLLSENAEIGKKTASETLKRLRKKGLLEWVGKNPYDPNQFYKLPENV